MRFGSARRNRLRRRPGLFVGLTPLLTAQSLAAVDAVRFAEISLVPPMLLSVPAVFVFTFVFAGPRGARGPSPAARGPVLLVAVLSWVIQAQTVTWNLLVDSNRVAGPLLLGRLPTAGPLGPLPPQLATPVPLLIMLAAMAAFATAGRDRLDPPTGSARNGLSRD